MTKNRKRLILTPLYIALNGYPHKELEEINRELSRRYTRSTTHFSAFERATRYTVNGILKSYTSGFYISNL